MAAKPTSIADLRALSKGKLNAMTKTDLVEIIMADKNTDTDSAISTLIKEVRELKSIQEETRQELIDQRKRESAVKEELNNMKKMVNEQSKILQQQQLYLERLDSRERAKNIVISGLVETVPFEGATTDKEKVNKVLTAMEVKSAVDSMTIKRIGKAIPDKVRPILVTVSSVDTRSEITSNSRKLKDAGENFRKIRVKKDVHPAIRREWKRLHEAEAAEKAKPENEGHTIHFDTKNRHLTRDGVIIDTWQPSYF